MAVAGLALAAVNAPETMAQETTGVEIYRTSTLQVTGVTVTTDGEYNFKNFEVEAPEAGSYYTEFWLLPARLADGSYSTFLVYVNDAYVGAVTPSYGNWQGARVDGHETLGLSEGKNVITVATPAPEFPEVETLKAAMNDSDVVFSPEAYEEYLGEAASGVISDVPEEDGICLYAAGTESAGMAHFSKRAPELHLLHDLQLHSRPGDICRNLKPRLSQNRHGLLRVRLFLAQYRKSGRPESRHRHSN